MLKAIHAGEDITAARQKAVQVSRSCAVCARPTRLSWWQTAVEETLAYYAFPEEHWRRIRTNSSLE
jgi:putative transposase